MSSLIQDPEEGNLKTEWVTARWFPGQSFPKGYLESERVFCHDAQKAWNAQARVKGSWAGLTREELRENTRKARMEHYLHWEATHADP